MECPAHISVVSVNKRMGLFQARRHRLVGACETIGEGVTRAPAFLAQQGPLEHALVRRSAGARIAKLVQYEVAVGLRLLVIEGNARAEREAQAIAYGRSASAAYAEVLGEIAADAQCDICYPADPQANIPDADGLAGYDGVAITGSALNLYDGGPQIAAQIELSRAIFAARTPCFGSCWGLQVAAAATGGDVMRNPKGREIGFARNIALNDAGAAHPLLAGRPAAFDAPCTHLDIVALPPSGAIALAGNAYSPMQAAEIHWAGGTFWGVQYHPEFSLADIAAILTRRVQRLQEEGIFAAASDCEAYCAALRALHVDPARADLAWRLGLDAQTIEASARRTELHNFIERFVRPEKSRRGRA